jgi:hypothetical protein
LGIDHVLRHRLAQPLSQLEDNLFDLGQSRTGFRCFPIEQFINGLLGLLQQLGFALGAGWFHTAFHGPLHF